MSTAMPTITFCPPGPHRPELETQQHLSSGSHLPVSAKLAADGEFESVGLSFNDYERMATTHHRLDSSRRLPKPEWATNDAMLRKLIVRYMEVRGMVGGAFNRRPGTGTDDERIKHAQAAIIARLPRRTATLDRLCKEYVELKRNGRNPQRAKMLEELIEGLDTYIRCSQEDGGMKLTVGIVAYYYRMGYNSVETAAAMKIKPPLVRRTCWQLENVWKRMERERRTRVHLSVRINMLRGMNLNPLRVPAKKEKVCFVCGRIFEQAHGHQKFCTRKCRHADENRRRRKNRELKPRAAKKFFCSTGCKDAARLAVHSLPVLQKPGIGVYAPLPTQDAFSRYADFCKVVGSVPLSREQWANGLR